MFDLTNPIYTDAEKARQHLEAIHWPNGPVCPHCGSVEVGVKVGGKKQSHRDGLYYCNGCGGQYTVTVGTVFERSHLPLNKWVLASHLMAASKKGMSAHQLHRMLGISYKSAWFMAHRLREAMKAEGVALGGEGKVIEADETYIGRMKDAKPSPARQGRPYLKPNRPARKRTVVALVERGGSVRSFHVEAATVGSVAAILAANADKASTLYTDESRLYPKTGAEFAGHETINHSAGEYARGTVNTNTIESVFAVFKRGMLGTYQHCGEKHLHRYLSEFDFRFNRRTALGVDDAQRTTELLAATRGKRLTYRRTNSGAVA